MNILAIETSCDETALALLSVTERGDDVEFNVLGDALYSQAKLHSEYGGVYPTLAKREHQKNLVPLTVRALTQANLFHPSEKALETLSQDFENIREEEFKHEVEKFLAHTTKPDIDVIAVTHGPGLEPALWTGVSFAEAMGQAWGIPVIGINHMEGHIVSALVSSVDTKTYTLPKPQFPVLALLISGGHTELVAMNDWFSYSLVGKTKDDAVGEAFDKTARLLGLSYPGGPQIDIYAARAEEKKEENTITLPRPLIHEDSCNFSFSGLKTAVLYLVNKIGTVSETDKEHIANEFQHAVSDVLVSKTQRALEQTGAKTLVIGGGVSANTFIRNAIATMVTEHFPETQFSTPPPKLTGDNAIMIGIAAGMRQVHNIPHTNEALCAQGSLTLT